MTKISKIVLLGINIEQQLFELYPLQYPLKDVFLSMSVTANLLCPPFLELQVQTNTKL